MTKTLPINGRSITWTRTTFRDEGIHLELPLLHNHFSSELMNAFDIIGCKEFLQVLSTHDHPPIITKDEISTAETVLEHVKKSIY